MPFNLQFQAQNAENVALQLEAGEILFVLGANGTGKSSLMVHFAKHNAGKTQKISAHRQTWMNTDGLDMTPDSKAQTEHNSGTRMGTRNRGIAMTMPRSVLA